jgi:hypothetical protein
MQLMDQVQGMLGSQGAAPAAGQAPGAGAGGVRSPSLGVHGDAHFECHGHASSGQ